MDNTDVTHDHRRSADPFLELSCSYSFDGSVAIQVLMVTAHIVGALICQLLCCVLCAPGPATSAY